MLVFVEEAMKGGLKCKIQGLENGFKTPKLLMIHSLNNERPIEQVTEQITKGE